jgi:mono/diheme cytochrome c family protein
MLRFVVTLLFTVAVLIITACSSRDGSNALVVNTANTTNTTAARTTPAPTATVDELASGRRIYMTSCANCHKEDGSGGEVTIEGKKLNPDDLTSAKVKGFDDAKILRYIMNGVPDEGMPAFKDTLSEAEMRDVLKFIRVDLQKMPAGAAAKS